MRRSAGCGPPRSGRAPVRVDRPLDPLQRQGGQPDSARSRRQEIVDRLAAYKSLGFTEVLLDFRRDSLDEMLDDLDAVGTEIRPAVDRA